MNRHAQALGRLNKGKKKNLSAGEIAARTARLVLARKLRWPKKRDSNTAESSASAIQNAAGNINKTLRREDGQESRGTDRSMI